MQEQENQQYSQSKSIRKGEAEDSNLDFRSPQPAHLLRQDTTGSNQAGLTNHSLEGVDPRGEENYDSPKTFNIELMKAASESVKHSETRRPTRRKSGA